MKKKLCIVLTMIIICVTSIQSVFAYSFYNIASEYDGLASSIRNNCVLFARYKVPSLPYGLTYYSEKKNISNSNTPIPGEIAIMPSSNAPSYGHVAYVEAVNGNTITIIEGGVRNKYDGVYHINRRSGTAGELEIYGYYNPGGLSVSQGSSGSGKPNGVGISEGVYSLSPKCAPGMSLDINGGVADSEANVHIWETNGTDAQKFQITKSGSSYTMMALCSNKMLDVCNGSSASGTNIWQYTPNGTISQNWSFADAGDGYYYIKSDLGTYLDVDNAGNTNGTNVWAWRFNGSNAQKWKLVRVSGSANIRTGVVTGTGGRTLAINSVPKAGNQIGAIPEGATMTIYPDKTSGNWYWVSYNGVSGYSYKGYITLK